MILRVNTGTCILGIFKIVLKRTNLIFLCRYKIYKALHELITKRCHIRRICIVKQPSEPPIEEIDLKSLTLNCKMIKNRIDIVIEYYFFEKQENYNVPMHFVHIDDILLIGSYNP